MHGFQAGPRLLNPCTALTQIIPILIRHNPNRYHTTLLKTFVLHCFLTKPFSQSGQLFSVPNKPFAPPKTLPRGKFFLDKAPRTARAQVVSSDQNLLLKMWDKTVFDDVDSEAYTNMKVVNGTGSMGLTSFKTTHVKLMSPIGRSVQVGDVLQYRIQSRDSNGRNRIVGGDLWYATLNSDKDPKASTAGHVVDRGNGTYDAYLLAAWPGSAKFNLVLVHVSEAIYYMRNTVWNAERRVVWLGRFSLKGKTVDSVCYLQTRGNWKGKCEYPAYRAMGSTVFLCDKKPDFPCESLYALIINQQAIEDRVRQLASGVEYLFKSPYYLQDVPLKNSKLRIEGSTFQPNLPGCKADQPMPAIQGYWMNNKWNSHLCKFRDWTAKSSIASCLRGKRVVLLGDSTTRQWLVGLTQMLNTTHGEIGNPGRMLLWSKRTYDSLNLTLYFQFPRYVMGLPTNKLEDMREEVDVLDGLNDADCNYVVVVSPWAHFCQWTRDSYIERVRRIRKALIDLRHRCPDIPIVIKGPHSRNTKLKTAKDTAIFAADYNAINIELIHREAFGGIGTFFLSVWDMNLSYPSPNNVHMPMVVVLEELRIFLGYVCDNLHPH